MDESVPSTFGRVSGAGCVKKALGYDDGKAEDKRSVRLPVEGKTLVVGHDIGVTSLDEQALAISFWAN